MSIAPIGARSRPRGLAMAADPALEAAAKDEKTAQVREAIADALERIQRKR